MSSHVARGGGRADYSLPKNDIVFAKSKGLLVRGDLKHRRRAGCAKRHWQGRPRNVGGNLQW
eukprot:1458071-Lingulodinium_polyedra.AAC.1